MQIHKLLQACGDKFKLWQSTKEQNFNKKLQRQRHQSAIREFGAPGRGCSPTHDGDSIYRKHCRPALQECLDDQVVTVAKSQLGLEYWAKSTTLRQLDRL
ncbi:hypothetical protein Zmor_017457 [Zophobas morio]|uniref:Uncharacterized protein n=1 Tax=Zophobas morio TaxID=2755281 RepID=A0AA38MCM2_9CUCU|nr:hypothetical protein Zmor_017457 [Zophobas morio]